LSFCARSLAIPPITAFGLRHQKNITKVFAQNFLICGRSGCWERRSPAGKSCLPTLRTLRNLRCGPAIWCLLVILESGRSRRAAGNRGQRSRKRIRKVNRADAWPNKPTNNQNTLLTGTFVQFDFHRTWRTIPVDRSQRSTAGLHPIGALAKRG